MLCAHVVSHTHWDREWYHPFVRFRQRLVALIDDLLDSPPLPDESFLLDGQAVIIEDYLEIRPERAVDVSSLLQSGQLEAGPWYVLADELIPSGEALVRNLLLGRRALRRLRASSPPVLYCPDSFGHPAALPAIAAGFGLPLIILWRGFGGRRWPSGDTVSWRAPDGESVVVYHLPPDGYEYGSALPVAAELARDRWRRMRGVLAPRAVLEIVLVPNGADHHARQRGHRQAVAALASAARSTGDTVRPSSLHAFADDVVLRAGSRSLYRIEGELRDSYGYTWTLQGTFASRAAQKRANARVERMLIRDAEPWAALASLVCKRSRRELFDAAWRTLLRAHPHDTLCGCSIDDVARAMDRRLEEAATQAAGLRDDAIADLVGYDPVASRSAGRQKWTPVVLVRNRAPRARHGVAIVEVTQFIADIPVGPGSAPKHALNDAEPVLPPLIAGALVQILDRRLAYDRVESLQHYPDNDLVAVTRAAIWVDAAPAYGIATLPLGAVHGRAAPRPVLVEKQSIDNGLVRVVVSDRGRVTIRDNESGHTLDDLLLIEDRIDRGDLYSPSIRGVAAVPRFLGVDIVRAGPLLGALRLRWALTPESEKADAVRTSELSVHLMLVAESPLLRLGVRGRNRMRDHRLRIGIRTGLAKPAIWADAAFGPVCREPLHVPSEDRFAETPPATAPLHRYVSLFGTANGATLFSDGLAEYEATADGNVFVTLVRAVGQLSRNDLPERPGHAGWPASTPGAQCLGRFAAELALLLHGARTPGTAYAVEQAADDALLPLEGRTLRSSLAVPPPFIGLELHGPGLAFSACKESEDGEYVVIRCVNLLEEAVDGAWELGAPIREAYRARLDETAGEPLTITERRIQFSAPPRAVVTILIR